MNGTMLRTKPNFRSIYPLFELLIVAMIVLIANRRAWYCFFIRDNQDYYCLYGSSLTDFSWWGVIVLGIGLLLLQRNLLKEYVDRWRANWPLLIFLVYSISSLLWTVDLSRSTHMLYILIAASLTSAGLATLYSEEQIFKGLLWFLGIAALASLAAVILFPQVMIIEVSYLAGSWRGVFAQKNFMGTLMGFANGLFLFGLLHARRDRRKVFLCAALYALTLFLVIKSKSATGLIDLLLLNGMILLYFAWRRWRGLLQAKHYVSIAGLLALAASLVLFNLGPLLSLIGKRASLTGRVPLWQYLLGEVVSKRPWFGYGLETLWYDRAFQSAVGIAAGWGIIVVNSHSGYMGILIYLGLIGLIILLLVAVHGLIRALQHALRSAGSHSFLPLLILVYVLVTNITINYFNEFESFHWVLLVLALFMATPREETQKALNA